MCLQELGKANVDTTSVYIEPTLPTSRAYVSRTEGTPEFRIARGADATLHFSELNMDSVTQASVIHASTFSLSLDPQTLATTTLLITDFIFCQTNVS